MTYTSKLILFIFIAVLVYIMVYYSFKMVEYGYIIKNKKPFFTFFHPIKRKLKTSQLRILKNQFLFYNRLSDKHKNYFEHRLASFIKDKHFIGREGLIINDEIKVLISATAVMLTFGFRNYYIGLIDKIFVYPEEFYSSSNQEYHKGEFNPKLETLVMSWKDFKHGFKIDDDNLNLGIHEFAHAIHMNSIKESDVSATIFSDSFKELTNFLSNNEDLRTNLIASKYFRDYAYTNQYEFIAVIIETFIETPQEFRNQFPKIYALVKQMLNFNFAGY